jgi:hypothetical protein
MDIVVVVSNDGCTHTPVSWDCKSGCCCGVKALWVGIKKMRNESSEQIKNRETRLWKEMER